MINSSSHPLMDSYEICKLKTHSNTLNIRNEE